MFIGSDYPARSQRWCISSCLWHVWAADFFLVSPLQKFQRKCFVFSVRWSSMMCIFHFLLVSFLLGAYINDIMVFVGCIVELFLRYGKKKKEEIDADHHGCYFLFWLICFYYTALNYLTGKSIRILEHGWLPADWLCLGMIVPGLVLIFWCIWDCIKRCWTDWRSTTSDCADFELRDSLCSWLSKIMDYIFQRHIAVIHFIFSSFCFNDYDHSYRLRGIGSCCKY